MLHVLEIHEPVVILKDKWEQRVEKMFSLQKNAGVGITDLGEISHPARSSAVIRSGRDHPWMPKAMGKACRGSRCSQILPHRLPTKYKGIKETFQWRNPVNTTLT